MLYSVRSIQSDSVQSDGMLFARVDCIHEHTRLGFRISAHYDAGEARSRSGHFICGITPVGT